uniref:Interferon-induced GTP-binding protein Mx n=1 Tax=Talaromyces marneffei PM1 TaxID=1077442 RepID=A0A093USG4_TALMA
MTCTGSQNAGISHYVSLPQIIVCGDQSSGKSSVLEAISGVSFPVRSNLCTRFPTELVLRKSSHVGVRVSIVPHPSRNESEQRSLGTFRETLDSFENLPVLIDKAKGVMGISTHGKAFSNDLLRVEVAGPDRPHLTIVDLPGLIHSETKQQSAADVQLVQDVVQSYMKEPRSIILAVVSAKNDFANQIVLRLARGADESGRRTMGVITKPDVLTPGSETEKMFVSLAKNQEVEFRLGWHVLKNMDTEQVRGSLADRDAQERNFFSQGVWEFMPPMLLGIDGLRERLSKLLLSQIATELPSLIEEIKIQVDEASEQIKRLGDARETLQQQRAYLFQISQSFQSTVKAAVDGTYNSHFFGDVHAESGFPKRLRAVVQNLSEEFAKKISREGHRRQICSPRDPKAVKAESQISLTRTEYIERIEKILKRTRGRELPGTFNPMIVCDLFMEQCALWRGITHEHIEEVARAVKRFIELTTGHIADNATSTVLMREVFQPKLDQLDKRRLQKTWNYSSHTPKRIRNERREKEVMRSIQRFFTSLELEPRSPTLEEVNIQELSKSIIQSTEPDMGKFASAEERFIDDIADQAIERELVAPLSDMLSPITVFEMEPDMVTCIAGETKEYRSLREQLGKKLDILGKGLETCKRFVGIRGIGLVAESKHVSEGNASQKVVQSTTAMTIDEPNEITLQPPQTPPDYATEIQLTPIESPAHDCNPLTLQEDSTNAHRESSS